MMGCTQRGFTYIEGDSLSKDENETQRIYQRIKHLILQIDDLLKSGRSKPGYLNEREVN